MLITRLDQFVAKLQAEGAEYLIADYGNGQVVWISRFGYPFNKDGRLRGGFVRDCGPEWQAEWREWAAMLEGAS